MSYKQSKSELANDNRALKQKNRSLSWDKEISRESCNEDNKSNSNDSISLSHKTRKTYTIAPKLDFIKKANNEGLKKTARIDGIVLTSLKRWIKDKDALNETLKKKKEKI